MKHGDSCAQGCGAPKRRCRALGLGCYRARRPGWREWQQPEWFGVEPDRRKPVLGNAIELLPVRCGTVFGAIRYRPRPEFH